MKCNDVRAGAGLGPPVEGHAQALRSAAPEADTVGAGGAAEGDGGGQGVEDVDAVRQSGPAEAQGQATPAGPDPEMELVPQLEGPAAAAAGAALPADAGAVPQEPGGEEFGGVREHVLGRVQRLRQLVHADVAAGLRVPGEGL